MGPINKPFDRLGKELSDEAPSLFVRTFLAPPESCDFEFTVRTLGKETSPPVRLVDSVSAVSINEGAEFVFHVEFCVSFSEEVLVVIACYGGSLAMQYRSVRIDSSLVLMDRWRAVPAMPAISEFANHETRVLHPFRVVRIWELNAAPILESAELRFLPWAVLMNTTEEEVREVAARVRGSGDEEVVARFLILGSLRYDREELERMLGGAYMGLMEAIMEGSSLVRDVRERAAAEARRAGLQEGLQEGRQEGRQQGRQEGLEEGRRQLLRAALAERFPGLDADPAVDSLSGTDAFSKILTAAYTGSSRGDLERLIHEAAFGDKS